MKLLALTEKKIGKKPVVGISAPSIPNRVNIVMVNAVMVNAFMVNVVTVNFWG